MLALSGIYTALVTPLRADGSVDRDALRALVERQVQAGVAGVVPCGTTGESATLTDEEWEQVVADTVEQVGGRVAVVAGVGSNSTWRSRAAAEAARALGADAGLLVLPYYNKPNPAGHRGHLESVAQAGLPLVLYHVPGRTAQWVPVGLLAELAEHPAVVGIKEATGDLRYGTDLVRRTTKAVLSGDDFSFVGLIAQGASGCISVLSNIDPAGTVALHRAVQSGQLRAAQEGLAARWALITALFADTNPIPCKAALAELGLCRPEVRLPLATNPGLDLTDALAFLKTGGAA